MLKACVSCAPRGVYVCGNTTSSTGLTVTIVKDPDTGGHNLEAGALVLADCGVCLDPDLSSNSLTQSYD